MASKKKGSKGTELPAVGPPAGLRSVTAVNRNRSNLVIGLTGPFGSGCSTMLRVLTREFKFHPYKISDDIRAEVQESGQAIAKGEAGWRRLLQEHGDARRKDRKDYWVRKVIQRIDEADVGEGPIVIDGFRNFHEVQEVRKIYPSFFLVAICAEKEERWNRVHKDYKGNFTEFEEDDRRDQNEDFDWGQSVQKCVDDADYVWYNNEPLRISLESGEDPAGARIERAFKKAADDFVPLMRGSEQHRGPTADEIHIAAAYAQSHASTCEKRHVGAIITVRKDGREFPISMGFNENPPSVRTCENEGACYKDDDMMERLKARGKKIFCPKCGKVHKDLSDPWNCSKCGTSLKAWLHPNRNMELCTAIHAEERAVLSLGGRSAEGGTLYVTTFPCFQCARLILDAGIKNLVYVEAYPVKNTAAFLEKNGIEKIRPFSGFTARAFFRVFPKVN
jgi:deoxycytidylate deaminase